VAKHPATFARYQSFTLEAGLYLVEPKGGRTYQARARVDGRWQYTGTETADYRAAEQFARRWFRQLKAGQDGHETIAQAATAYFESIRDPNKRKYHETKWEAVREFWSPGFDRKSIVVAAIDTPKILEFVQWRQKRTTLGRSANGQITANTLHKDLVTLRQILKFAVARGVISNVPVFPGAHIIGSIEANPQPWLTKDEWKRLMQVAADRIKAAPNTRTRAQRQELRDFCEFMLMTGLRVDEARKLQVRDVAIAYTDKTAPGVIPAPTSKPFTKSRRNVMVQFQHPYFRIRVRESKTGPRVCHSRIGGYLVLGRLTEGKAPTDRLFREHHRDSFRELLIAAGLRTNAYGLPRNTKCLRPTAISHWLLDKPTIPLSWLAANCGTSITMLQSFYVKRLGLNLDGSAWL